MTLKKAKIVNAVIVKATKKNLDGQCNCACGNEGQRVDSDCACGNEWGGQCDACQLTY